MGDDLMVRPWLFVFGLACVWMDYGVKTHAEDFSLRLQSGSTKATEATWKADKTAVILCDVWDYHHCFNAQNRLGEMLPRMNELIAEARRRGATIIHAPSDCMPYYETHAARLRVSEIPVKDLPKDIASWCSVAPSEEGANAIPYPLDQSDGGEDDDPEAHQKWASHLKSLGRNPSMPWKAQSPAITIDAERDFISDRGDEVWSILRHRKIDHVILLGVHTNMCVLGRPFGLRQMVKQKIEVVLVRDMTDCMYNPKRWPFVDHFSGNDLLWNYVENAICPTITSDQILGGKAFRFQGDLRTGGQVSPGNIMEKEWLRRPTFVNDRMVEFIPGGKGRDGYVYARCAVRLAHGTLDKPVTLTVNGPILGAWLNGHALQLSPKEDSDEKHYQITKDDTFGNDDANVLVLKMDFSKHAKDAIMIPSISTLKGKHELRLWEATRGDDPSLQNIPLPAKFGMSPEVYQSIE